MASAAPAALSPPPAPTVALTASAAERDAEAELRAVVAKLERFGMGGDGDRALWSEVNAAATALIGAVGSGSTPPPSSAAEAFALHARFEGDWRLVATTSAAADKGQGITGVGRAPFTKPHALFERVRPLRPGGDLNLPSKAAAAAVAGAVGAGTPVAPPCTHEFVSAEVLEFWGKPSIKNELTGRIAWGGRDGRERVEQVDGGVVAGQENPDAYRLDERARSLTLGALTADGALRVDAGPEPGAHAVWERVGDYDAWFAQRSLPVTGGSVVPGQ